MASLQTDAIQPIEASMTSERTVNRNRPPRTHEERATNVYVVSREDGKCKVGISRSVARRRSGMQQATPDRLTIHSTVRPASLSALDVERQAHAALSPWRLSGEWFSCPAALAALVVREVQVEGSPLPHFLTLLLAYEAALAAEETAARHSHTLSRRHEPEEKAAAKAIHELMIGRMVAAEREIVKHYRSWVEEAVPAIWL